MILLSLWLILYLITFYVKTSTFLRTVFKYQMALRWSQHHIASQPVNCYCHQNVALPNPSKLIDRESIRSQEGDWERTNSHVTPVCFTVKALRWLHSICFFYRNKEHSFRAVWTGLGRWFRGDRSCPASMDSGVWAPPSTCRTPCDMHTCKPSIQAQAHTFYTETKRSWDQMNPPLCWGCIYLLRVRVCVAYSCGGH